MHSNIILKKVKEDYNKIAEDFSLTRNRTWGEFQFFKPYLRSDGEILDLGCGNGRLLLFFKKFKNYLGIDNSKNLIAFAKKNFPKNRFIIDDISKLKLRKKFDYIFLIASFHHVPPEKHLEVLSNYKTLLKKDGYIFMTNWNLHQKKYLPFLISSFICPSYGIRGTLIPWKNKIKRYYYSFTKAKLRKLFRKAGFKLILNEYVKDSKKANIFTAKNVLTIAKYE